MSKVVDAIYVNGVFKPQTKPYLSENQEVRLTIEPAASTVETTKGIIKVPTESSNEVIEVIESPNYSVLES